MEGDEKSEAESHTMNEKNQKLYEASDLGDSGYCSASFSEKLRSYDISGNTPLQRWLEQIPSEEPWTLYTSSFIHDSDLRLRDTLSTINQSFNLSLPVHHPQYSPFSPEPKAQLEPRRRLELRFRKLLKPKACKKQT